ncbi:hypothetical protein PIB30_032607 [Stylosanthes scabra]|uniref:Secreted protein n=1 Tax=Stylosanthes scabra TaxID=79078 RepID=A0ABU6TBX3_9FABA|nr:hypothetical protein [Stylosanthes scabra]
MRRSMCLALHMFKVVATCFDACAWLSQHCEEPCLPCICVLSCAYAWLWEGLAKLGHICFSKTGFKGLEETRRCLEDDEVLESSKSELRSLRRESVLPITPWPLDQHHLAAQPLDRGLCMSKCVKHGCQMRQRHTISASGNRSRSFQNEERESVDDGFQFSRRIMFQPHLGRRFPAPPSFPCNPLLTDSLSSSAARSPSSFIWAVHYCIMRR